MASQDAGVLLPLFWGLNDGESIKIKGEGTEKMANVEEDGARLRDIVLRRI